MQVGQPAKNHFHLNSLDLIVYRAHCARQRRQKVCASPMLPNHVQPSHVRSQHRRHYHRAIGLLIVL